jgi:hypothetical protein
MTILDSNGLIYLLTNGKALPAEELIVTDDLREEYDTALLVNGHHSLSLIDISSLPMFEEAYYYKEYANYLNNFPGVSVASMRSLTDVSILALVSCIMNRFGQDQQISLDLGDEKEELITVITGDENLAKRLTADFGARVNVIDVTSL